MPPTKITTRLIIISDTHGAKPSPSSPSATNRPSHPLIRSPPASNAFRDPLPHADVLLHCGDLTKHSAAEEYRDTFAALRAHTAPLKLVIAGNHDLALDPPYWKRIGGTAEEEVQVRDIVAEAEQDGVKYLTEGVHSFELSNGAQLRVYVSQHTPEFGGWAFQYRDGHEFAIPSDIDVVMTHGPPRGILDESRMGHCNAGCPDLLRAVQRARPQIHCFGHIHEAWGGYLAKWIDGGDACERLDSIIDADSSIRIMTLQDFNSGAQDRELLDVSRVDLTKGVHRLQEGDQTLFVNAAIMNTGYWPVQHPWLVDIELPRAHDAST